MYTFLLPFTPAIDGYPHAPATRAALAAALIAAASVAWPSLALAQQDDMAASSAQATAPGEGAQQTDDDANQPDATRRSSDDERRLLGGPQSAYDDPYASDDPSPKAQEEELMNEQRMTIVSPSDFYSSERSGSPAASGQTTGDADGTGTGGARRHFGRMASTSSPSSGNQTDSTAGAPGAVQNYGYNPGGPSSPVYPRPYDTQPATEAAPYRSPW